MKHITLAFEFADMVDALDFMGRVNGVTLDPDAPNELPPKKMVVNCIPVDTPPPVYKLDGDDPGAYKVDDDNPVGEDGKKITATKVKAALAMYKENFGHKKYKSFLEYFGVTAVRDIPKKDFSAVMMMVEGGPVVVDADVVDADVVPTVDYLGDLDTPAITGEQLKQGLSEHKSRWGLEATLDLISRMGYNTPNDIPLDKFGEVFTALANDNPAETIEETMGGVDLSMF